MKDIRNIAVFTANNRKKIAMEDKMLLFMNNEEYDDSNSDFGIRCEGDIEPSMNQYTTTESWLKREINMISFSSIWESYTMRVIDGGITLLSATSEIEPMMIELRKVQIKYDIPSVILVGEMEKKGADFFTLVEQIGVKLITVPLVTQLPINKETKFGGLIDLISMKEIVWENNDSYSRERFIEYEIREELLSQAVEYRDKIIEQIVEIEGNENLMEKFLDDREITQEEMVEGIRIATASMVVTPILLACLSTNKGIKKLLNAVVEYLPSPSLTIQAETIENHEKVILHARADEPFVGVVFATCRYLCRGDWSVVRIYRGSLKLDTCVYNSTQTKEEKINRIIKNSSLRGTEVSEVFTGDIAYVQRLKANIGDTLCDLDHKVMFEKIKIFEPIFFVKIIVKDKSCGNSRIENIFGQISRENLSCWIQYSESLYDPISIYGESKLLLVEILNRLTNEFKLDISSDKIQVLTHRTIKRTVRKEYIYERVSDTYPKKMFAHVCLELEPRKRGEGYKFVNKTKGGIVPCEFMYHISQGIEKALHEGIDGKSRIVDIKVTLYGGSYHDIYSNNEAFKMAGYIGIKKVLKEEDFLLQDL